MKLKIEIPSHAPTPFNPNDFIIIFMIFSKGNVS